MPRWPDVRAPAQPGPGLIAMRWDRVASSSSSSREGRCPVGSRQQVVASRQHAPVCSRPDRARQSRTHTLLQRARSASARIAGNGPGGDTLQCGRSCSRVLGRLGRICNVQGWSRRCRGAAGAAAVLESKPADVDAAHGRRAEWPRRRRSRSRLNRSARRALRFHSEQRMPPRWDEPAATLDLSTPRGSLKAFERKLISAEVSWRCRCPLGPEGACFRPLAWARS